MEHSGVNDFSSVGVEVSRMVSDRVRLLLGVYGIFWVSVHSVLCVFLRKSIFDLKIKEKRVGQVFVKEEERNGTSYGAVNESRIRCLGLII